MELQLPHSFPRHQTEVSGQTNEQADLHLGKNTFHAYSKACRAPELISKLRSRKGLAVT